MNDHWPTEEEMKLGWRISWLRQELGRSDLTPSQRNRLQRELDSLMQGNAC